MTNDFFGIRCFSWCSLEVHKHCVCSSVYKQRYTLIKMSSGPLNNKTFVDTRCGIKRDSGFIYVVLQKKTKGCKLKVIAKLGLPWNRIDEVFIP
jgi:hypothetical protein